MNLKIGLRDVNTGAYQVHGVPFLSLCVSALTVGGSVATALARPTGDSATPFVSTTLVPAESQRLAKALSEPSSAKVKSPSGPHPSTWLTYLSGSSVRQQCGATAADTYRFVYNADFAEQVRTYDLTVPHDRRRPATFIARVFASGTGESDIGGFSAYRASVWAQRSMSYADIQPVLNALDKSGFGALPRSRASLSSDTFYWVVSACIHGAFEMSAWAELSAKPGLALFAEELFSLDETAVPVRTPAQTSAEQEAMRWGAGRSLAPAAPNEAGPVFKVKLTGNGNLTLDR